MNPFAPVDNGPDYEAIECEEILFKHNGIFKAGAWEWNLDERLGNMKLNDKMNPLVMEYLVIATGHVASAINQSLPNKSLLGSYKIETQIMKGTFPYSKFPQFLQLNLYSANNSSYILICSHEIPSHLYTIISTDVFKVLNPKKSLIVSLSGEEYQKSSHSYSKLGTSACNKEYEQMNNENVIVDGFAASMLTMV